jgi:nitroreductase
MNPQLRPLFARRSIRKYTDQPVTEEVVRDLLEAAMAAPSAVAKDPWHFVVVRNPATLKAIAGGLTNGRHLAQAAVGIAVCGEISRAHDTDPAYLVQDCSAATENLLLAASLLGLGACWCGIYPLADRIELLRRTLKIPAGIIPVALISIGWPAQRADARSRFRASAVHDERW